MRTFFASLLAVAGSWAGHGLQAEEGADTARPAGVLTFTNGDRLPGALARSTNPGELAWQSPNFIEPFRFDARLLYLEEIRFDVPEALEKPKEPYRLVLMNGDALYGRLAAWGDEDLVFASSVAGRLRVKQAEVRRLERVGEHAAVLYSGPNSAAEWAPSPQLDAWKETGDGLATEMPQASLYLDLELPPQARIEIKLSWRQAADFELLFGAGKQAQEPWPACRLECIEGALIVRRESEADLDLAQVMNLRAGPGSLHLLVQLDQQRQQVDVLSGDGVLLATVKTGKDAPQVLSGIYLKHGRGGLTLERLRVSRASGAAPVEMLVNAPRIQRTDGTVLYGSPITYDVERREFRVVSGKDERVCSEDAVDQVILNPISDEQPQATQRPASRVSFADGTRLSGWIEGLADERLLLECREAVDADTLEAVSLPLAGIRSIVFSHKVSPPTRTAGKLLLLELDDGRLHGALESIKDDAGKSRLAWKPLGSETSSAFSADASGRIDFPATTLPKRLEFDAQAKDRLFLRTGDVYRCRIVRIDASGISFQVADKPLQKLPHARVKAIEFGSQPTGDPLPKDKRERLLTLPRLQKDDPPTHILCSSGGDYLRGRLLDVSEDQLRFEVNGRPREFWRRLISRIIWLHPDELDGSGEPPGDFKLPQGAVQITRIDGTRVTLVPDEVEDGWISGENELLGPRRVHVEQESELLLGKQVLRNAAKSPYGEWRLTSAVEPAVSRMDASQAADAGAAGLGSSLIGRPAIDFDAELLNGATFRLSERKGKIVVVDFWASWCAPCMQSLPKIAQAVKGFPPEQVELVAVNLQQTPAEINDALHRLKLSLTVALDREGKVAGQYGASSIPFTVVIGPEGKVARVFIGASPRLEETLAEALRALGAKDAPAEAAGGE